jgi:type II secretory ATPase GspE/PulE/Tfp pilus assembly ATPase PilB-like protein
LRAQARKDGMTGLLQEGLAKVKTGEISLQELLRVVR